MVRQPSVVPGFAKPVSAVSRVRRSAWAAGDASEGWRHVPEETAVAFTYNRSAHAVMMATPADLEDFALGFSLNEGVVGRPSDIEELEVIRAEDGLELRMWIGAARGSLFYERRRFLAGPTGCGLCGLESLAEAMRPAPRVEADLSVSADMVCEAMRALAKEQAVHRQTHAVHAAACWLPGAGVVALREDVGRHNALDKLAGALARKSLSAGDGIVCLTSRVSVEMVQKSARMGAAIVAAISAPTALAIRVANEAGITLIAVARKDGFEVFTHPRRIKESAGSAWRSTGARQALAQA